VLSGSGRGSFAGRESGRFRSGIRARGIPVSVVARAAQAVGAWIHPRESLREGEERNGALRDGLSGGLADAPAPGAGAAMIPFLVVALLPQQVDAVHYMDSRKSGALLSRVENAAELREFQRI